MRFIYINNTFKINKHVLEPCASISSKVLMETIASTGSPASWDVPNSD